MSNDKPTESTTRPSDGGGTRRTPVDRAFSLNVKYVADLEDLHKGDLTAILTSVINAQIQVLSSMYDGDETAVAQRYVNMANGVAYRLLNGDVPLAKGVRH